MWPFDPNARRRRGRASRSSDPSLQARGPYFGQRTDQACLRHRLTIANLDIDSNTSIPGRYGIRGIPTVILYKNGQAAAQSVGAMSKSKLTAFLDSNL